MIQRKISIFVCFVGFLAGCAPPPNIPYKSIYEMHSAPAISLREAETQALDLINRDSENKNFGLQFQETGLNGKMNTNDFPCTYSAMQLRVFKNPHQRYIVALMPGVAWFGTDNCGYQLGFDRLADAEKMMDLLYLIKLYRLQGITPDSEFAAAKKAEAEAFQKTATWYLAQNPKPKLPEEARKYAVQAEASVEHKKYYEAVGYYNDALKVSPWWPQGYYNKAQVLAGKENYPEAIAEMKKYLLLMPNAADSREAQDDIYKWESMSSASK